MRSHRLILSGVSRLLAPGCSELRNTALPVITQCSSRSSSSSSSSFSTAAPPPPPPLPPASGPLVGVRVLDLGQVVAGNFCGGLLVSTCVQHTVLETSISSRRPSTSAFVDLTADSPLAAAAGDATAVAAAAARRCRCCRPTLARM